MKTVLLTGANGFIGRHVAARLEARDVRVLCVGRGAPVGSAGPSSRRELQCDLLDPPSVRRLFAEERPTHWLHLAWVTDHGRFWSAPENLDWVAGTLLALRAFQAAGGERVVMAGTCAEYAPEGALCDEQRTPCRPRSLYAASKLATRRLLSSFSEETGLSSAWGPIFQPYGPGEPEARFLPSVVRALLRGEPLACSHGRQLRDFLFVEDVADAFAALLVSEVRGTVNVASGEAVSLREVAEKAAKLCGAPAGLIDFGALEARADEPELLVADVRRLREEVGWRPSLSLDAGLERCLHYGRSRWPKATPG